ncbi:hypothetical protein FB451DRAFT_1559455 [Mycena latifolia]|nr:hypothetical protein FB451DRAFT_1559455 [Mycena latifolia]
MKAITTIICFSSFLSVYGIPVALTDGSMSASSVMVDSSSPSASSTTVSKSFLASGGDSPSPSGSSTTASNSAVASILPAGNIKLGVNADSGTLSAYDNSGKPLGNFTANAKPAAVEKPTGSRVKGALMADAASAAADSTTIVQTCRPATDEELSKVPGWNKLLDAAAAWATNGQQPAKAYLNFDGYTNPNPAQICYSPDPITLSASGTPNCNVQIDDEKIKADEIAPNTTVTRSWGAQLTHGTSSSISTTTTKTSQWSWSATISATANFDIAEVGMSTTIGLQVTDTQGTEQVSTTDDTSQTDYSLQSVPGKTCGFQANITDCTYETTGQIELVLSGDAWFEWNAGFRHPDCTKDLISPGKPCEGKGAAHNDLNHCYDANGCQEHSHWNVAFETWLPDASDRSDPIQFKSGVSSHSYANDPEAVKVRQWRHKLQKTFLSNSKLPPDQDEMPEIDALFTTIEEYQNMTLDYLTYSKVEKVMRHITRLAPNMLPRDDEFNFRERARLLVDKWYLIIHGRDERGSARETGGESDAESAALTQGIARMGLNATRRGLSYALSPLFSSPLHHTESRRRQLTAARM